MAKSKTVPITINAILILIQIAIIYAHFNYDYTYHAILRLPYSLNTCFDCEPEAYRLVKYTVISSIIISFISLFYNLNQMKNQKNRYYAILTVINILISIFLIIAYQLHKPLLG